MTTSPTTTKIINFVGGPGSGKTAMCCLLFAEMKMRGLCVEYIPEVAKNLVWRRQFNLLNNQHYVSTRQYEMMKAVEGKVDYIVTDGPLLHGVYYNRNNPDNYCDITKTENMILSMMSEFENHYVHVTKGDFPYERVGRLETEEQSIKIGNEILEILHDLKEEVLPIVSGKHALHDLFNFIGKKTMKKETKESREKKVINEQHTVEQVVG